MPSTLVWARKPQDRNPLRQPVASKGSSPLPPTRRRILVGTLLFTFLIHLGCGKHPDDGITFLDEVKSQSEVAADFSEIKFTNSDGETLSLVNAMTRDYLVLVVTRGWNNAICLYCASQTSKWARRHDELAPFDASLAIVFPTETEADNDRVNDFYRKIKGGDIPNDSIPFPVLLDVQLESVDKLGLRAELAKPSTYILDREGRVMFAYVGQSAADRPSVDAILKQLDRLQR